MARKTKTKRTTRTTKTRTKKTVTLWSQVRSFVLRRKVGSAFTTTKLLNTIKTGNTYRAKKYCTYLTSAGILDVKGNNLVVSPAVAMIDKTTSLHDVRYMAYTA